MRIAHVVSYLQPEFGYEEYYTAREQAAMGHEVHVITSDRIFPFKDVEKMLSDIGSKHRDRKRPVGKEEVAGFTVHRGGTTIEVLYDLILYKGVRGALEEIGPDVVHAHGLWQWGTYQAAKAKKDLGYRLIIDEHAYSTTYDQRRTLRNWLLDKEYRMVRAPFARYSLKRADGVVAICQETVDFLRSFYGLKRAKLIEMGIDQDQFRMRPKAREKVRRELGAGDGFLLVTAGRLESAKRLELFIEGVKLLKRDDVKLVIVGRGDEGYLEELKRISNDRIIFKGFKTQEELADLYSAADIGLWGKASITIREAMGCSLPLLLLDERNMKDLLKWDNGMFSHRSARGVRDTLQEMMSDRGRLREMGRNSRKGVMEELSVKVQAERLLRFYGKGP